MPEVSPVKSLETAWSPPPVKDKLTCEFTGSVKSSFKITVVAPANVFEVPHKKLTEVTVTIFGLTNPFNVTVEPVKALTGCVDKVGVANMLAVVKERISPRTVPALIRK